MPKKVVTWEIVLKIGDSEKLLRVRAFSDERWAVRYGITRFGMKEHISQNSLNGWFVRVRTFKAFTVPLSELSNSLQENNSSQQKSNNN